MRVVLDANVLVSALLRFQNAPSAEICAAIRANQLILVTSKAILAEVQDVLSRDRLAIKYQLSPQKQRALVAEIQAVAYVVKTKMSISAVAADPDDNKILACAMKGKAAYIVTGDPHLLDLHGFHQIKIVTPRAFLAVLNAKSETNTGLT